MTLKHSDPPFVSLAGLHSRALDQLGLAICAGELGPGSSLTLEEIEERCGISRSVARETVRVLEAMRLVVSRRRIGVVVLPESEWNLYDPQVIRWRLDSPDRAEQLSSMVELRAAIEPEAARLAATRATADEVSELIALSGRLWAAGEQGDDERFLKLDVEFHARILRLSGNAMFSRLDGLIGQMLVSRTEHGLVPDRPASVALQLHVDVAGAIQRRDPEGAYAIMRSILVAALDEIDGLSVAAERVASTHVGR
ncbi:MAG TPA: FCD domain-containing protein [Microbacterium sp.]|uniref:FadR/GntR family transcriptional regulator n=1 Tax=Microbacterium sp. TaxID=51671 RepID=UPI002B9314F5|nr:FCD domain-containing protein [Microbacterium sp.]HWI29905.1 FCD domain-containing protein [Microbacterium sp.]